MSASPKGKAGSGGELLTREVDCRRDAPSSKHIHVDGPNRDEVSSAVPAGMAALQAKQGEAGRLHSFGRAERNYPNRDGTNTGRDSRQEAEEQGKLGDSGSGGHPVRCIFDQKGDRKSVV